MLKVNLGSLYAYKGGISKNTTFDFTTERHCDTHMRQICPRAQPITQITANFAPEPLNKQASRKNYQPYI